MTPAKPGVNLVGFVGGERGQGPSVRLGLGEIVGRLARALERAGIPFVTVPYLPASARSSSFQVDLAVYDTNLICLNADYLGGFMADAGVEFFEGRTSIAFWFWETSRFRLDRHTPLAFLDEVWVASAYVRDAVAAEVDIPVFVAPLPMDVSAPPTLTRSDLGLPEGYQFLFTFNFVSGIRKNPEAVLEAFTRAFAPGEGPVLVLKSVNGRERKPALLSALERAVGDRQDVLVIDRYASEEETRAMIAGCDCYVSLHRSEGLGLTMAEAMALGKPVVATGYSGNLEFMDDSNSYLVPYELVEVPTNWWSYTPGATWADPDVEAAARIMRHAWEHPDEARAVGERAREDLLERFSLQRAADDVFDRLADIRAQGAVAGRASRHDARPALVEASRALAPEIGASLLRDRRARPTSSVRRFLRRALWPYLAEQRRVDTAVVEAVTLLQRSIEDIERRICQLEKSGASTPAPDRADTQPETTLSPARPREQPP
jgi:glycosyltransferase involved in cell wall biosynthesis